MNDEAFTLYTAPPKIYKKGQFRKGRTPWNKGLSWEQQGWTDERKKKVISRLRENREKNKYHSYDHLKKPVIQMDKYGDRLHWYESSEAAARKLGVHGRNIRKVCDGERHTCGGYYFKWDERFK